MEGMKSKGAKESMEDIYQKLTEIELIDKAELIDDNKIIIPTGYVYGEQSELVLHLVEINGIHNLTDYMQTIYRLDNVFELVMPDVIKNFRAANNHYNQTRNQRKVFRYYKKFE